MLALCPGQEAGIEEAGFVEISILARTASWQASIKWSMF